MNKIKHRICSQYHFMFTLDLQQFNKAVHLKPPQGN